MTLPAGVSYYSDRGHRTAVTQRGWWTTMKMPDGDIEKHYTSCMLACLSILLEWAGYQVPLKRAKDAYAGTDPKVENMVYALHKATGRPLWSGTTLQDSQVALEKLWADEPKKPEINFGTMSRREVRIALDGGAAIRFSARPLTDMPKIWDLPAGYRGNGHAFVSNRRTRWNSSKNFREIWIVDPMLRPWTGYIGQWVSFSKFLEYCDMFDNEYVVTWTDRSSAL